MRLLELAAIQALFLSVAQRLLQLTVIPMRSPQEAALVAAHDPNLILQQGRFSNLDALARAAGFEEVDGVVADIGVSSMQIDQGRTWFFVSKRRTARHAHGTDRGQRG